MIPLLYFLFLKCLKLFAKLFFLVFLFFNYYNWILINYYLNCILNNPIGECKSFRVILKVFWLVNVIKINFFYIFLFLFKVSNWNLAFWFTFWLVDWNFFKIVNTINLITIEVLLRFRLLRFWSFFLKWIKVWQIFLLVVIFC